MKTYYENILPHILPPGATFHVVFRLFDSIPKAVLDDLLEEFEHKKRKFLETNEENQSLGNKSIKPSLFSKYESYLDKGNYGKCHLSNKSVAQIIANKIISYDSKHYTLIAFCIMPNHVHLLIDTKIQLDTENEYVQLYKIMQLIKGGSAYLINKKLGREGRLWKRESYDHYIRNEKELVNTIEYIRQNPLKANLKKQFTEWPFLYIHPDYEE